MKMVESHARTAKFSKLKVILMFIAVMVWTGLVDNHSEIWRKYSIEGVDRNRLAQMCSTTFIRPNADMLQKQFRATKKIK